MHLIFKRDLKIYIALQEQISKPRDLVYKAMIEMMDVYEMNGTVSNTSTSSQTNFFSCEMSLPELWGKHNKATTMVHLTYDYMKKYTLVKAAINVESPCNDLRTYLKYKLLFTPFIKATAREHLNRFKHRVQKCL